MDHKDYYKPCSLTDPTIVMKTCKGQQAYHIVGERIVIIVSEERSIYIWSLYKMEFSFFFTEKRKTKFGSAAMPINTQTVNCKFP